VERAEVRRHIIKFPDECSRLQHQPAHRVSPTHSGEPLPSSVIRDHFGRFAADYDSHYAKELGNLRMERIARVAKRFLSCGDCRQGLARIRGSNTEFRHEYFSIAAVVTYQPSASRYGSTRTSTPLIMEGGFDLNGQFSCLPIPDTGPLSECLCRRSNRSLPEVGSHRGELRPDAAVLEARAREELPAPRNQRARCDGLTEDLRASVEAVFNKASSSAKVQVVRLKRKDMQHELATAVAGGTPPESSAASASVDEISTSKVVNELSRFTSCRGRVLHRRR
jgi:hypothetical protein